MGAGAAAGAGAAGGLVNAYAQIKAGNEAFKTSKRQQKYLNQQAADVIDAGDFNQTMAVEQGNQIQAQQRVGYAAGGVDVSSGSAQRVQASTAAAAKLDAEQIRKNAFDQAFGLITQGNEITRQGASAKQASRFAALGSILGAGSSGYSAYSSYGRA